MKMIKLYIGHLSQRSRDSEMEQEPTNTDTGNAGLLDVVDEEKKKTAIWIDIWLAQMVQNGHITKWNEPLLELDLKI